MPVSAEVATLFLEEMARRNIPVQIGEGGGYEVEVNGSTSTISLENLSRDFARDRDPERIKNFADTITSAVQIPDWEAARSRIRWSLEPTDMPLADALHDKVSDQIALVLVHVSPDESQVMWLNNSLAETWGQTKDTLFSAAVENMHKLLAEASIEVETIDGHQLGMLSTTYVAFKAALVFCPDFKGLVEPVLGWPLFAVLPCRDFVYVLPQRDADLLGRVGHVVVQEYNQGAYPLCTEVFELTDQGIRATGEFQKVPPPEGAEEEEEEDEDGMKTIRYRGGVVTFRIPEYWEEEYEEEGGGTFYDEDVDAGTLRLNTITAQSKTPVTTHTAREMAQKRATAESGTLTGLGGGNWMVEYTQTYDETEDEGALTIRYWEITNPVPPNHLRVAIFSYSVRTELFEGNDAEVIDELAMLDRELRLCTFASEIGE
jgi:hypothetical protein